MLACLGMVTPELVQAPTGFNGFKFAPEFSELNAIKALGAVPKLGIAQILLVIAFAEISTFSKVYNEKFTYEDNLTPLERQKVVQGRFGDLSGAAKTQVSLFSCVCFVLLSCVYLFPGAMLCCGVLQICPF